MKDNKTEHAFIYENREAQLEPGGIGMVFSHELTKDGELDEEAKSRLDKALELYKKGDIRYFVLMGGTFREGMERPIAEDMEKYLIKSGIPKNAIMVEKLSKDTATNILFGYLDVVKRFGSPRYSEEKTMATEDDLIGEFANIAKKHPITWISSAYHLERIERLLRGNNFDTTAFDFAAPREFDIPSTLKEFVIDEIARALLLFEPGGRGSITTALRNRSRGNK